MGIFSAKTILDPDEHRWSPVMLGSNRLLSFLVMHINYVRVILDALRMQVFVLSRVYASTEEMLLATGQVIVPTEHLAHIGHVFVESGVGNSFSLG